MASVAVYRGHTHTDGEVNLVNVSIRTQYSARNRRLTETRTMQLQGELIYDGPSAIVAKANAVMAAYSQDGGDFTYTVGGVLAHSLLNSANCISGVRVVHRSFPSGGPEQLATTRSFSVTLQATYDVSTDDIVSWRESVELTGNGAPLIVIANTIFGPVVDVLSASTAHFYRQSGTAVGFSGYPAPPGPLDPDWELGHRRSITRTSGVQQGTGIRYYTTSWAYYLVTGPGGTLNTTPSSL